MTNLAYNVVICVWARHVYVDTSQYKIFVMIFAVTRSPCIKCKQGSMKLQYPWKTFKLSLEGRDDKIVTTILHSLKLLPNTCKTFSQISFKIKDFVVNTYLMILFKINHAPFRGEHFAKWKFANLVKLQESQTINLGKFSHYTVEHLMCDGACRRHVCSNTAT